MSLIAKSVRLHSVHNTILESYTSTAKTRATCKSRVKWQMWLLMIEAKHGQYCHSNNKEQFAKLNESPGA